MDGCGHRYRAPYRYCRNTEHRTQQQKGEPMNHLRRFSLSLLAAAIITGCAFGQNQMSYQVIVAPESMQPSGNLGVLVILKSDAATFDVRLSYYDNVGDFRETTKTVTVADAFTPVTVLFSAQIGRA